ncbi:hypothetical protein, partial [Sansalvadorimonas verongulae]|uniref:hypothetical protein n=1 Tax=Sansalvadorimonas verongulae TaxID=2172824 RepID=UPI001E2CA97E
CSHSVDDLEEVRACSSTLYDELLHLPLDISNPIWGFDCGFYMVGHNFVREPQNVSECFLDGGGNYVHDFLKFMDVVDSNSAPLEHKTTISRLHGLQLVNYLYVGQDLTWT